MSFAPSRLRPLFEQVLRSRQAGLVAEANELCARILQAPPSSADDLYCQGSVLMQFGRIGEAAQRFDSAVQLGPATPELLVDRGVALAALGHLEDAVESCARASSLNPDFVHAHFIHGDCLREMGRFEEALDSFGRALALFPDFIAVLVNRGVILTSLGRFDEALADYDRLLRLRPGDPDILSDRGQVLSQLARFDEALQDFDRALAINPRHPRALSNRGVVLAAMARFDEALASYDQALALNPGLALTLSNRANALQELLRLDEALAAHDRVIALEPDFASGHWNRSQGLLLRGDWKEGFREAEWRRRRPESAGDYLSVPQPEWLGAEDLAGKTLLIRAEQGLGDTLQFCRYAALAQAKGAKVILAVQDSMVRLLQKGLIPPADQVIARNVPLPDFDFHIPAMSLPLAFGTDSGTVPVHIPYLKADADLAAVWRARIGAEGFRVGLCWRGNLGTDPARAFPLAEAAPLARMPGVRLISLQKGGGETPDGMKLETLGDHFENGDFADTAAILENLDLVISCDTAVAHLAGAMGRAAWLALKFVPDWRWGLKGDTAPWYPAVRLFRQKTAGAWAEVFTQMHAALAQRLAN